jgi:hypothetical protein
LIRLLAHWYYMARATAWLLLAFGRAHLYFKHRAIGDLQLPHPESLTSQERRRLQHYFYGGTLLSILFSTLRGRTRSHAEKRRLTNLAALAYFFDDLVDSFRHRDDTGILWRDNPEEYGLAADDHRRLALHFLQNLYNDLPPNQLEAFRATMHRVFNVETAGRQQSDLRLETREIEQLTREKGGYSVLLFRMVHTPLPSPSEAAALLEFGHLIQQCDDIFDVWFDLQANVRTLATEQVKTGQIAALRAQFDQQVATMQQVFLAVEQPQRRIRTALCVAHYIAAIGRVCLDHYAALLEKNGDLPLSDRKRMVVDMEEWGNRVRAGWYLVVG